MNNLRVEIEVANLDGARRRSVLALADTGSSHTALSASLLRDLGIEAADTQEFRHGDGSMREYPVGLARVRVEGRESYSRVVFLDDGAEPRLGFITLAELGLEVDPDAMHLVPAPGYLL